MQQPLVLPCAKGSEQVLAQEAEALGLQNIRQGVAVVERLQRSGRIGGAHVVVGPLLGVDGPHGLDQARGDRTAVEVGTGLREPVPAALAKEEVLPRMWEPGVEPLDDKGPRAGRDNPAPRATSYSGAGAGHNRGGRADNRNKM